MINALHQYRAFILVFVGVLLLNGLFYLESWWGMVGLIPMVLGMNVTRIKSINLSTNEYK